MSEKLLPLDKIQAEVSWWPYSEWQTARLIRDGKLGAVRVGRRVFLTPGLIDEFIARHTAPAGKTVAA